MLALMQQQPPPALPDIYTRSMSLAVLPSSPVTGYDNQHHDFSTATSPSPSKRPKLSIDTSSVAPSSFGKKATSLRLETLSATSPTVRNTFSNAHEQKGSRLRLTPIATNFSSSPEPATPFQLDDDVPTEGPRPTGSLASSGSSISSISDLSTQADDAVPYKLPFNHASILKNGPLSNEPRSTTSFFAQSKPMFPAAKKVSFRAPLTEEVVTEKFTLRHSDIETVEDGSVSTLDLNEVKQDVGREDDAVEPQKEERMDAPLKVKTTSPHTGDKRESSDEEEDEEERDESYPTTPVAGRRKRHRQWRWTLGPVGSLSSEEDTTTSIDSSTSANEDKRVMEDEEKNKEGR